MDEIVEDIMKLIVQFKEKQNTDWLHAYNNVMNEVDRKVFDCMQDRYMKGVK